MKEILYKQCSRCVMDTTDPDIVFDENGHCNHCIDFSNKTTKRIYQNDLGNAKLSQIVEKIKKSGRNNEYDCILGMSGGVDSCYLAYTIKKVGLRVLVVHIDNGWNSEGSVNNIKKVIQKLGFGYQSFILDWEEFKSLQLAFLRASIVDAEIPTDFAIPGALHKVAVEKKIKYILSGSNFATEGILPKTWGYNCKDEKLFKTIQKRYGSVKLKNFPTFGYKKEMYYKFIKRIKIIYPLNYIAYSKKEALEILEREFNWKSFGGKHYESIFTGFLHAYILPLKFNLDYRLATFSTQICMGEMTREDALLELQKKPYNQEKIEDEINYFCKKMRLSRNEFEELMKIPPKTYRDFPNSEGKLEFIYSIYRKISRR